MRFLFLILLMFTCLCKGTSLVEIHPAFVGMDAHKLALIDGAVSEAIENKQCPGAVVLVSRFANVVWFRAYGNRCVEPQIEPMTRDTIFDIASMTKPLATATAIMILVEQKKLALNDLVTKHIPEFGCNGKKHITIEQLLRHRSGLPPDSPAHNYPNMQKALEHICTLPLVFKSGTSFCYSCIGYIVLCEIIQRVSGKTLDVFTHEHIFSPLQMHNTMFNPPQMLVDKIAPTEKRYGIVLRGQVHDSRAYSLGGVSGNAGLFSCAQDIVAFAHMMLNKGKMNNVHILDEKTITTMTSPGDAPKGQPYGLGWNFDALTTCPSGEGFPLESFGHSGFTGTLLWIDPISQTVIVILTNQLHPSGTGSDVVPLRKKITAIVADAITDTH